MISSVFLCLPRRSRIAVLSEYICHENRKNAGCGKSWEYGGCSKAVTLCFAGNFLTTNDRFPGALSCSSNQLFRTHSSEHYRGQNPPVPTGTEAVERKISCPAWNRNPTVRSLVRHYTDWVTPARHDVRIKFNEIMSFSSEVIEGSIEKSWCSVGFSL